jgi:hypothetical protein
VKSGIGSGTALFVDSGKELIGISCQGVTPTLMYSVARMPTVFDNITTPFLENDQGNGLRDPLKLAVQGDICVGYFNLRGWRSIDDVVEAWPKVDSAPCRLLVGMTVSPDEELRLLLATGSDHTRLDNATVGGLRFHPQLRHQVPSRSRSRWQRGR